MQIYKNALNSKLLILLNFVDTGMGWNDLPSSNLITKNNRNLVSQIIIYLTVKLKARSTFDVAQHYYATLTMFWLRRDDRRDEGEKWWRKRKKAINKDKPETTRK